MGLWEGRKGRKALSWVLSAPVWINADNVGCHHVSAVALIAGYCATPPVYAQWVRVLRNSDVPAWLGLRALALAWPEVALAL